MSREIKFRAWDIKNKRFVNIVRLIFDQFGVLDYAEVVFKGKIYKLYPSEIVLEQDIGGVDVNGKRICEGDIIEVFSTDEYLARFEGVYRVYFDNMWLSYMMYKVKSHYSSVTEPFEPEMYDNIEIIGNIHENPELLGGGE